MTATRVASTHWEGSLLEGNGQISLDSSKLGSFDVTWASRAESPEGRTSPEELLAGAHTTCFLMVLTNLLTKAGHTVASLDASAEVDFVPGTGITEIRLSVRGDVPGLGEEEFVSTAQQAKENCPVSKALAGVPSITLDAKLV
ncbi:OsmC family peroxiredoxin [Longispora albida]|uniref:OsmC family peroxiredoxin n=1 Tax=Longispora albida TaxID=203523 RepID=UPI0003786C75|nr:OsmC family peroxiredoxin [Longispora albida]